MRLREIINIRTVVALLVICTLTVTKSASYAQVQDSTISSTTAAIDTAIKASSAELSPSSSPLISTAVDTVARYKNMQPAAVTKDYSESYRSATYYVLMFFLLCVFVAIIGKILKVYELSREVQGIKVSFNGVGFKVFSLVSYCS